MDEFRVGGLEYRKDPAEQTRTWRFGPFAIWHKICPGLARSNLVRSFVGSTENVYTYYILRRFPFRAKNKRDSMAKTTALVPKEARKVDKDIPSSSCPLESRGTNILAGELEMTDKNVLPSMTV